MDCGWIQIKSKREIMVYRENHNKGWHEAFVNWQHLHASSSWHLTAPPEMKAFIHMIYRTFCQVIFRLLNLLAHSGHWGVCETSVCQALPACPSSDSSLQMQPVQHFVSAEQVRDGRQNAA